MGVLIQSWSRSKWVLDIHWKRGSSILVFNSTNVCTSTTQHCVWYSLGTGWIWPQWKKFPYTTLGGPKNDITWKSLGCRVLNGVSWGSPVAKTLAACGPSGFSLWTSLGVPFTTPPPRLFQIMSKCLHMVHDLNILLWCKENKNTIGLHFKASHFTFNILGICEIFKDLVGKTWQQLYS